VLLIHGGAYTHGSLRSHGLLAVARAANERGELLLAGAFTEPADGAALVFKANGRAVAERFAASDPYVKEGLVKHWRVRTEP